MFARIGTLLFITTVLFGCATNNRIRSKNIANFFNKSAIINNHFTGFELYDLDKHQPIFELNSAKYFTPASNTKLFTFYTCLNLIGDSIPSIRYAIQGDSLLFEGTGDPALLHPDMKGNAAINFLKAQTKKLYLCSGNYRNDFYGSGWAWDDYNVYYQAEINSLPLYGNTIYFYADATGKLNVSPGYFNRMLKTDSTSSAKSFRITRDFLTNIFRYPAIAPAKTYRQWVPYKASDDLTIKLLSDTLKKTVNLTHTPFPANSKTIYSTNADTVYRHMLQPSDNFIAEQLLLVCSAVKYGYLDADSVRQYAIKNLLTDLPDEPQWADGSGLSRLNLFTPRSIIKLLEKIRAKVNNDALLFSLMPNGGVSGTIRTAYKTDNGSPFVFAKTGSLSNNYNQSGYLVTRKGRKLAFCFMNNNFTDATRPIRDDMVRIITAIHENY